jgi:hypothetical protein
MELGGWLRSLGLEKYEALLRDNEIDEVVLHKLTEDHLPELGVPLGARLKLLEAIRRARVLHACSLDFGRHTVSLDPPSPLKTLPSAVKSL